MIKDEKGSISSKILNVVLIIIILSAICFLYQIYQENNFNDFKKSEGIVGITEFKKDNNVKYSDQRSYKMTSNSYNDAMFSKKVQVEPNKSYKITCMAKTQNVKSENDTKGVGAQISIGETTTRSTAIEGTHDWQKIELIFNSQNKTEVEIGFRLGGYLGNCTGTAWFSDFTLEEGVADTSNEWNFACFIFDKTDVTIEGKEVSLQVSKNDINDIESTIERFSSSCKGLSEGKMTAKYDIYNVDTPITSLSYDKEFGYYVAPEDVEEQIKDTINSNNYDHIFIVVRLGNDENQDAIPINDWIGLGSMDYYGIGFSNIRLPNDSKSYIYKYNTQINTFPEEVFLHEFLHSLERTSKEYGYDIPALHDYEKYGYQNERLDGQKKWYKDYMNKNIEVSAQKIGLPNEIYTLKPAKNIDFEYSYKMNVFKQPENIIQEIKELFSELGKKVELVFVKE